MPKTNNTPTTSPSGKENLQEHASGQPEPLSGSKKVKNRNHSRNNHGEGF